MTLYLKPVATLEGVAAAAPYGGDLNRAEYAGARLPARFAFGEERADDISCSYPRSSMGPCWYFASLPEDAGLIALAIPA